MQLAALPRLWRTVRHLRAEQVLGRAWFRLNRPRPDLRPAPTLRAASGDWQRPARRACSLVAPQRLNLLNVEHDLSAIGWDAPQVDLLWRYNQHYFDDLNAFDATLRRSAQAALIDAWIAANPPGQGTGWAPYPLSLRSVNWIKAFAADLAPRPTWLDSLAVQLRWLRRKLEWHLLGNHLFVNAKALVYGGLHFKGAEAEAWLDCGLRILERELPEQILADGGQFERSPMYHALALEDVLDLINIIAARAPEHSPARRIETRLREIASRMLHWLRCMVHADGSLARFNDCADGVAPDIAELERFAAALGVHAAPAPDRGLTHLDASGYLRQRCGDALLLADIAALGPDYLLGHAHADTLAFELSVGRRRLIVNGGTSRYGLGVERLRERSTAMHSTVEVDRLDSSEVWSGFRVGRRARPFDLRLDDGWIHCAHDGYCYLPGSPLHRRGWRLADGVLDVVDHVEYHGGDHEAVAHFPLAFGLRLQAEGASSWTVRDGEFLAARIEILAGKARCLEATLPVGFGDLRPNQQLEVRLIRGRSHTRWTWNSYAHPFSD